MICSCECTWCATCVRSVLGGICPNCQGTLSQRPTRSAELLKKHPASTARVLKRGRCGARP